MAIMLQLFYGNMYYYLAILEFYDKFYSVFLFVIGNDILHQLTAYHTQKLKIVLTDFENITKHADYDTFYVGDEGSGYLLTIGGYSGDAGK